MASTTFPGRGDVLVALLFAELEHAASESTTGALIAAAKTFQERDRETVIR